MATKLSKLFKGKDDFKEEIKEAKAIKSGKLSPMQYAMGEKMEKKKYAAGGTVRGTGAAVRGKNFSGDGFKKGGKC